MAVILSDDHTRARNSPLREGIRGGANARGAVATRASPHFAPSAHGEALVP